MPLTSVFHARTAKVLHRHIFVTFKGQEDVIGVGIEKVLRKMVHIIAVNQAQAMDGEFLIKGLLGREGILQ